MFVTKHDYALQDAACRCAVVHCKVVRVILQNQNAYGVQGRPLLARLGRRTVLILDIPYVHQLLEAYVSKLLALSYAVASVDVHSADPTDHFVHCFTHRRAICCDSWLLADMPHICLYVAKENDASKALKTFL